MEHRHHAATTLAPPVVIMVQDTRLICTQTPIGSWVCCAEEGVRACARGFTPLAAAANWERAEQLGE